jgi:two-component system, NtrC family, response regulator AtoC
MARRPRILIVDDEDYVRDSLVEVLAAEGLSTATASSVDEALAVLAAQTIHLVLTDLSMPGRGGMELLGEAKRISPSTPVVMMTGVGTLRDAIEAIKGGAYDFLQKPIDVEQMLLAVRRALEHHELVSEVSVLRDSLRESRASHGLVGGSPAVSRIRDLIDQVAPTDATVLVTGESGTGKELVAEQIHAGSPRASQAFVRVNCAAIPSTLFESEFFGHRRGSFSGAVADRVGRFAEAKGGTIVLDEIGTLPLEMQAKLLRVLENGEFQVVGESRTRSTDARVIALTNENLAERVQKGEFRADLFYRLDVFPITLPPLRAHKEDLPEIAGALLAQIRRRSSTAAAFASELTPDALEVLGSYDWPGNVRELRNVLERAAILSRTRPLDGEHIRGLLESALPLSTSAAPDDCNLRRNLDQLEKQLVLRALELSGGRKKDAAQLLGIDPRNLGYYLRKHALGAG